MANKINYRREGGRNRFRTQRPSSQDSQAHSCAGEGHNGKIGRAKWVVMSRRKRRRSDRVRLLVGQDIVEPRFRKNLMRSYR